MEEKKELENTVNEKVEEKSDQKVVVGEPVEIEDGDAGLQVCEKCGATYKEDYDFCPECGTKLTGAVAATAAAVAGAIASAPKEPQKKKRSKKALIIIGAIVVAAIIAAVAFAKITAERPLLLNSGQDMEVYVGDKGTISIAGDGLEEGDYQMTLWTSNNEDVIKVNNGEIEAFYDSSSFNAISEDVDGDTDYDSCSCTTYVNASIEKGIRKWAGSVRIKVSLKPVELKDGKVIKKPADSRDSSLEVTTSDDYDAYIYLKSKSKAANDMAFTVKRGKTTTVDVPRNKYDLYWATGTTWYGSEFLFGPDTICQKSDEEWDFENYTWTFKMGVENGNLGSDFVNEDEFPEL